MDPWLGQKNPIAVQARHWCWICWQIWSDPLISEIYMLWTRQPFSTSFCFQKDGNWSACVSTSLCVCVCLCWFPFVWFIDLFGSLVGWKRYVKYQPITTTCSCPASDRYHGAPAESRISGMDTGRQVYWNSTGGDCWKLDVDSFWLHPLVFVGTITLLGGGFKLFLFLTATWDLPKWFNLTNLFQFGRFLFRSSTSPLVEQPPRWFFGRLFLTKRKGRSHDN